MNVAAVDLGTNSLRLLVLSDEGTVVRRENRIVRLGQGVDATRRILPAALDRVAVVLDEYGGLLRADEVEQVRMVATSAARSAANPDDLRVVVSEHLGVPLDIIDGDEEARLSFVGATGALRARGALPPGDVLVVDLGGGSTEFVRGRHDVSVARSVDIGSVRLTERVLSGDPPAAAEVDRAVAVIDAALDDAFAAVPLDGLGAVVGVAGTVTTVTAVALGLARYDARRIDGAVVPVVETQRACEALLGMSVRQRRDRGIPAGRADVIGSGALIWSRILTRVAHTTGLSSSIASEADILDGVARGLLSAGDAPP